MPVIVVVVFLLALIPRATQGEFVTVDEAFHWFSRSERFLEALRTGDYAATNVIGHPGVTTMWLGATGVMIHGGLADAGLVSGDDPALFRWFLRLPVALVTSLCVALAYVLLVRLVDRRVALTAVLLWATEPFLIAYSQLLHLDALLTSFVNVSLLAALVAFLARPPDSQQLIDWKALGVAGVATGLALLTKSPSIILGPMLGLIAIASGWRLWAHRGSRTVRELAGPWRTLGGALLTCGAIAITTWFVLWPALWVDVGGAIDRMVHQATSEGGSPHGWGNFFWGQTVDDPGPFFYVAVLALRTTPWTLLGVLVGIVGALVVWRQKGVRIPYIVGILAIFVLLFAGTLTILPKKFDRYLLPVFPALCLFAAAGWVWLFDVVRQWLATRRSVSEQLLQLQGRLLMVVLLAVLTLNLVWYHPYTIAYYNPLFGGGSVATQILPVGWGEGYEQAGAYVSAQPDGRDRPVASWFEPVLDPFVEQAVVPLDWVFEPGQVDYAVLYIDQIQRGNVPEAITYLREQFTPIHTVVIHGIEYAYVYQLPQPVSNPVEATVGDSIRFRGYDLDTSAIRASSHLTVTLHWQALDIVPQDYLLFAHVLDAEGNQVAQVDVPPGGERAPTSTWQPQHYVTSVQRIPVPADLPAGTYWVALGVYDPATFERLPIDVVPPPNAPDDGPNVFFLTPFTLD
ncbi:MAG: glycosyltransferase family 39 protein [Chloroflexota bacterium]